MRLYEEVLEFLPSEDKIGLLCGLYRSVFRGKGLEFEDLRQYAPGDDPKSFSWAKYAATRELYTKTFREERELHVYLVVDPSITLRWLHPFKWDKTVETVSLLALSAALNRDKLGAAYIDHDMKIRIDQAIRGGSFIRHAISTIHKLTNNSHLKAPLYDWSDIAHAPPSLTRLLESLSLSIKQAHAMIFVISDFFSCDEAQRQEMKRLKARHDLIAIRMTDKWDRDPLPLSEAMLCSASSPLAFHPFLDPFDEKRADELKKELQREIVGIKNEFARMQIDLIDVCEKGARTDIHDYEESPFLMLKSYFESRLVQRRRRA